MFLALYTLGAACSLLDQMPTATNDPDCDKWALRYNAGGRLRVVCESKLHVVLVRCDEPIGSMLIKLESVYRTTFTIYQKQRGRCGRHPLPAELPISIDVRMMPHNLGRECVGILQYLHDEYGRLPPLIAFLQWGAELHLPLPLPLTLAALHNFTGGFMALSKNSFEGNWPVPCEDADQSKALRACADEYWYYTTRAQLHSLPPQSQEAKPPVKFRFYANGMFAVARDRVRAHPQGFYKLLLDRHLGLAPLACVGGAHHRAFAPWANSSAFVRAEADCLMLEKTWHLAFGESPTLPPPAVYNEMRFPAAWRKANLKHAQVVRASRIQCK